MSENEKRILTRQEFEEQIIKKAQSDKDFRQSLVKNPKETLGQLGVQVPEEIEVKVMEESANVFYLVLPVNPDDLADEQLDFVTGGCCFGDCCAVDNNWVGYFGGRWNELCRGVWEILVP